jgi:hypothetical protein
MEGGVIRNNGSVSAADTDTPVEGGPDEIRKLYLNISSFESLLALNAPKCKKLKNG